MSEPLSELSGRVRAGDQRAAARLMRLLDDRDPRGVECLKELYPLTGKARIIGVTGSPGAGKSTLVNSIVKAYRGQGRRVGVVAIDPTSPFSGGTILGDRIRMQQHETDPGVFIRSVATRGALGGLSRSTSDIVKVMDAFGCDIVLIETVGVGQDEVDIVREAETSIVVMVPGMGDEVQAIKAGILEIADIFVINKADRPGADQVEKDLRLMIEIGHRSEAGWNIPILRSVATKSEGIDAIVQAADSHHTFLSEHDHEARRAARIEAETWLIFEDMLRNWGLSAARKHEAAAILAQVKRRELDPYSAAQVLLERVRKGG